MGGGLASGIGPVEQTGKDPVETVVAVLQVVIALGLYNVWLVRYGKPSRWRGGDAQNMKEEFAVYGLPGWMVGVVGFLKLLFATGLLVGIWVPALTRPSALGIAVLMLGAVAMHVKVGDPIQRALPALSLLLLSLVVVSLHGGA